MTALLLLCWFAIGDAGPRDAEADAAVKDAAPAAPRARLRGLVLSKGTREPLAGASVTVDAKAAGETGAEGRFDVEVPAGRRRVQIQHPGFEPFDVVVEALAEAGPGAPEQVFRLAPRQSGERYETVVTAADERAPRTSLRDEELLRLPGSFGDPFRTVESLPGVSQVLWPLALYAIRGANPGNTGFFIDGMRVPTLFHFALGPSVIHPFFVEQIDFYPGGYPVRYGRYVSGIVATRTSSPRVDKPHASADVRLFDAGGIVVAPWHGGAGTVAAAGRVSYTGLLFSQFSPRYVLSYWDYQLRADHRLGPGRVTAFAFGSGDVLGEKQRVQNAALSFHRLDLRWDGAVAGGRGEVGLLLGRDASATSIEPLAALPVGITTLTAAPRMSYSRPLAPWADLELGADAEFQRFRPDSEAIEKQDLFVDRDATSAGAFLAATLRWGTRLSVAPGLRADAFFEQGVRRIEPSPRLTVRVRPAGNVWLKATAGRFAQMASLPVAVPGFENFGLADYGTQTSLQGSVGVEAPLGEALSLDVTGFTQRLRLTDLESVFIYDPQRQILELRDGRSFGVEVLLRRPLGKRLHGWLAYTLSKSERVVGEYRLRVPSDWDQRHIVNLVVGYRLRRGYALGARVHYNTGRPYPVFDQRSGVPDYLKLPDFYQLDLRADKRFVFDKFVLDAYVEVVNATFTREVYDIKRGADGRLDTKAFRIALPSVGVHAEW